MITILISLDCNLIENGTSRYRKKGGRGKQEGVVSLAE